MRHFHFLADDERRHLFYREPGDFTRGDDRELLATALGATLYSPATRPNLASDITALASRGLVSAVICLEDSIADSQVAIGQRNVIDQLGQSQLITGARPLLFVRVRRPEQIGEIVDGLGAAHSVLTGFVLPKFAAATGREYLDAVAKASADIGRTLLAMPVLESPEIVFAETRVAQLLAIRELLLAFREHILAVRFGATDLSAVFGLRRERGLTVYDVRVITEAIASVVNVLARDCGAYESGRGFVITGPVWEHFMHSERIFKPQLRESPFIERHERALRSRLIAQNLDGLIREVSLDRANGLCGKTVIHPSHIAAVHALSVVSHEEFADANDISAAASEGGALASRYRNKMNEARPHLAWARRTLLRAEIFGVAQEGVSFVDLLGAAL